MWNSLTWVVQEWCDRGFSTASTCLRVKYERATGRSERSEWSGRASVLPNDGAERSCN